MIARRERVIGGLQIGFERLFLAVALPQDRIEIQVGKLEQLDLVAGALRAAPVGLRQRLAEGGSLRMTDDDR